MTVARLGDATTCGVITGGVSSSTFADGIPIARLGSTTSCPCNAPDPPFTSTIISAVAASMFVDGIPVAIIGSLDGCPASVAQGSPSTGAV